MKRFSKRIITLNSLVQKKNFECEEAVKLIKKLQTAKFIESVEAHIRLNLDPKYANQQLRTSLVLPYGN
jgi:large subunit ribosomal protein L1